MHHVLITSFSAYVRQGNDGVDGRVFNGDLLDEKLNLATNGIFTEPYGIQVKNIYID